MKNTAIKIKYKVYKSLAVFTTVLLIILSSCKYQRVQPTTYPDQKLYMGTADVAINGPGADGIFRINTVSIPGQVSRYTVDNASKKFNILLGAIRAGASVDGDAVVSINSSADTIGKLITLNRLPSDTQLLPSSSFKLTNTVTIASGSTSVSFPLIIDLDFLLTNPNKRFALAVSISSADRIVNPLLKTTIILIDTQFLFPTALFTAAADPNNNKLINFTNLSTNAATYSWDFGDGTALSPLKSPTHTYTAAGNYTVKLVVIGATGDAQKAIFSSGVTVL